jgi:hypothetical protein
MQSTSTQVISSAVQCSADLPESVRDCIHAINEPANNHRDQADRAISNECLQVNSEWQQAPSQQGAPRVSLSVVLEWAAAIMAPTNFESVMMSFKGADVANRFPNPFRFGAFKYV